MHGPAVLASILPALSCALAHPLRQRDTSDFTITSLNATFPYPYPPYGLDAVDSSVNVGLTYPGADSSLSSTTCSVGWPSGTNPGPTDWTACADAALQFRLPTDGWTSTTNFRVEFWQPSTSDA
jgi:hypothetical protein